MEPSSKDQVALEKKAERTQLILKLVMIILIMLPFILAWSLGAIHF